MDSRDLIIEEKEGVVILTINRPAKMNALGKEAISEIEQVLHSVQKDEGKHSLVISGSGNVFSVGADVEEFKSLTPHQIQEQGDEVKELLDKIELLGKPVVAAINGMALGGGFELALACTVRIASSKAKMGLPEAGLGVMPGWGGTQRLPRLIGQGRALEILLTGRPISAEEALSIGLVTKVVSPEDLLSFCLGFLSEVGRKGPIAINYIIKSVNRGMRMSLESGSVLESALEGLLFSTEDSKEGISAFLEKRQPKFLGK